MGAKIVEICIREVCAYTVSQSGGGAGKKVKEKTEGSQAWSPFLFIQLGVMGVIFNFCSSASWRIILGLDSVMFLPFYIL